MEDEERPGRPRKATCRRRPATCACLAVVPVAKRQLASRCTSVRATVCARGGSGPGRPGSR
eukprot:363965-Chlamydomonas_euryale.AAC.10